MKVTTDSCLFGAWAAREMRNVPDIKNLLDIGGGTGLLSLMVAQQNSLHIHTVEIDREAAEQAKANVADSPWAGRIHVFNEDILSFKPGKYDGVISNPPFYEGEWTSDETRKNIAHHSEQLTLAQVLELIKQQLKPGGVFFLLLPFKRDKEIEGLLMETQLFAMKKVLVSPSPLHSPSRIMIMGTNEAGAAVEVSHIDIRDRQQHYTPEFTALLRDYYLHL
jgi:tRNA1Val (adenine37-N6)-methyltransferase